MLGCTVWAALSLLLSVTDGFTVSLPSSTPSGGVVFARRSALQMEATDSVFELPEDNMPGGSSSRSLESYLTQEQLPSKYAQGDELYRLRQNVLSLRRELEHARSNNDVLKTRRVSRRILDAQQRDAEFMYQVSLERMEAASLAGLTDESEVYREQAEEARSALPQFQLEGLWVGKYGDDFQLINVTYAGDVLTAHKVTGDRNVPKGQVTFQVDLSPGVSHDQPLDPIELSDDAVSQWGSRFLQRHAGKGQVASDGFVNSQWLDGQLILVNQYFSFAWLPTGHQVFFGRPSPELTLKLLREKELSSSSSLLSSQSSPRQYLARCLEETELLDDEMEVSSGIFRSHDQDYYYNTPGCFE